MAYKNIKNIIINTSCNLFREKGYDNVSINEICSDCSITKPTFYYHFKSKEDILFSQFYIVLENVFTSLPAPSKSDSGLSQLTTAFNFIMDSLTGLGYDFIQNLLIGSLRNIEHVINAPDTFRKYLVVLIKKGQKDGSVTNVTKPDILYYSCYHAFLGYILFWCQHNGLLAKGITLEGILLPILCGRI